MITCLYILIDTDVLSAVMYQLSRLLAPLVSQDRSVFRSSLRHASPFERFDTILINTNDWDDRNCSLSGADRAGMNWVAETIEQMPGGMMTNA